MVERLTGTDLAELALDVGPQPRVVAAVVELAPPRVTADEVRALLARRAAGSRLLGRRVRRVPPGCGRAVWEPVEPDLDVHVVAASCGDGDRAVLALASRAMTVPMPRARPLWRLVVADRPSGSTALIWVSHHAIGDGPTVLRAVVDALADGPASPGPSAAAPVSELDLARDALVSRVRALSRWRAGLRLLRDAERDLRGGRGLPAAATSFNRAPSGPGMRFVLARISLAAVRDGAATCGATVNDAVLCAVGRALGEELERRGEPARDLVATVAATFRRDRGPAGPRNEVGGMLVPIPTDLHVHATTRLRAVADASREHKRTLSPATPVVMAPVLRAASAAGLGRRFFERQRMVNVAVTTLPGPRELPPMCGREVRALVPLSPIVGNVPVTVVALSSGGELTVSLCLGRDLWRSANALAGAVQGELATIGALAGNRRGSTVVG